MPASIRPGDVLADRYRLVDLLSESGNGRFWRAHDRVLERHVALHVIASDDPRAEGLLAAARRSATVLDPRILRVLDAERSGGLCYVVNEWGSGTSLDIMLAAGGELAPRRAAWLVGQVASAGAVAHGAGVPHGRLNPENVLVDTSGAVRVIGWCVDAALHGRPTGSPEDDVADLVGLLYAALTGRWAGPSSSAVPPAPTDHGRVLRPRQVRAGIPRDLDTLCDEVLNPGTGAGPRSAREVRDLLQDFVGDPAGLQESMVSRLVSRRPETVVLPQVPEFAVRDPDAPTASVDTADEDSDDPGAETASPAEESGERTRAELPGFLTEDPEDSEDSEGSDGSEGLEDSAGSPRREPDSRTRAVAPPPPFEEPPSRPLFAPDPPAGTPARRSRHPAASAVSADSQQFWPWDTGTGHATGYASGPATDTGWPTGTGPVVDDEVPGRNTFRLAALLLAGLVIVVAVAVAFNLGRGRTPLGTVPEDDATSGSPSAQAREPLAPIQAAGVTDLDPQGEDGDENGDQAPLVVDGDPATTWRSSTYLQDFGPAGLKTGVGLVVDLGSRQEVAAVDLRLVGAPTGVQLYLDDEAPDADPSLGAEPAAQVEAGEQEEVVLDQPVTGRYLTLWFTSLPAVPDGFRVELAEVVVRG